MSLLDGYIGNAPDAGITCLRKGNRILVILSETKDLLYVRLISYAFEMLYCVPA